MQSKKMDGKRPRISVSLDSEDYDWIESLPGMAESLSFKLSRVVKAARLAGLTIDDASHSRRGSTWLDFLKEKTDSALAQELAKLYEEYEITNPIKRGIYVAPDFGKAVELAKPVDLREKKSKPKKR